MLLKLIKFNALILLNCFIPKKYMYYIYKNFINIGLQSLFIIGTTLSCLGASLVLNSYINIDIQRESIIPKLVVLSMIREAAPLFAGIMLNARVGSAITSEIGNMKITNQLDAMRFLGVSPIQYLILPKQYALILISPILFVISNIMGIIGGMFIYTYFLKYNAQAYIYYVLQSITVSDIYIGLFKMFVFCQIIGISSSFFGYTCKNTTKDLSNATVNSIVFSSISILVFNYLITQVCT